MKLYFDTNIYRFITARDEVLQVAALLEKYDCRLSVSAGNLFETYAMKSVPNKAKEMATITKLGKDYLPYPTSYLHALEVQREIRRLRPRWLDPVPRKRQLNAFLDDYKSLWIRALSGNVPSATDLGLYRTIAERGIASMREFQKDIRATFLGPTGTFELRTPSGQTISINCRDPEVFWRFDGLSVWHEAVERENPASRDYADWLRPFLRPHVFADSSYPSFWLQEVSADAMPLNRLTGLVSYYQLKQKITHGNSEDMIHASCWLLYDLFLTADRGFYESLVSAAQHYPNRAFPVFVNRDGSSFSEQLNEILKASPKARAR